MCRVWPERLVEHPLHRVWLVRIAAKLGPELSERGVPSQLSYALVIWPQRIG